MIWILDSPSGLARRNFKLFFFFNEVYFVQLQYAHYLNGKIYIKIEKKSLIITAFKTTIDKTRDFGAKVYACDIY